ncbi:MAG: AAA family ATPase [Acidobacteria bacterium]|nr:AAA family ATPase [Acidobacteriota bacterium]
MLITKLELKDIKNYTEKEFCFSPGVTAICGVNGAGKTTIIESIAWALLII